MDSKKNDYYSMLAFQFFGLFWESTTLDFFSLSLSQLCQQLTSIIQWPVGSCWAVGCCCFYTTGPKKEECTGAFFLANTHKVLFRWWVHRALLCTPVFFSKYLILILPMAFIYNLSPKNWKLLICIQKSVKHRNDQRNLGFFTCKFATQYGI